MSKVKIFKKDGTPTPYFWSNRDSGDRRHETVYKQTDSGVKRMKGVHFDAVKNRIVKED
jgi:hypothetical protein